MKKHIISTSVLVSSLALSTAAMAQTVSPIEKVMSGIDIDAQTDAIANSGSDWGLVVLAVAGIFLAFVMIKRAFR